MTGSPLTPLVEEEIRPRDHRAAVLAAIDRDVARLRARRDEFVEVPCPACGSPRWRFGLEKKTFRFVTCCECRTLYMSPRPSERLMAWYYADSETYRVWARRTFPASERARREKIHRPRLDRLVRSCERFGVRPGTLVEVGAGFGTFAALAAETRAFERVLVVEPTPQMAEACRRRGLEVVERRVETVAGEVPPADVVVAFEVIEHLFRPRLFVEQVRRLARPGGLLALTCPNGLGFDVVTLGPESSAVDAEHVNLFNPASLAGLVTDCGLEVLETATPGRLDAELVRTACLEGRHDLAGSPFLRRVLVEEWERLGWPFQQFLADHGLSSHLWLIARVTPSG